MAWNSRRLIFWTSGLILAPLLLALIAFAVLVWGIDPDLFRGRVESAASEALGREVRLTGGLHWRPGLNLQIENRGGEVAGAEGFGPAPFASWRALRFGLEVRPLLKKQVHIDSIEIEGLQLDLQRAADGAVNWQFQPAAPRGGNTDSTMQLRVGRVALREGSLRYRDAAASRDHTVTALRLDARLPEDFSADALQFSGVELHARVAGAPVAAPGAKLVLRMPELKFQKAAKHFAIPAWELHWNDTELDGSAAGQGGERVAAQGRLRLQSPSLRDLLASLSFAAPPTRDDDVLGTLQLAARFSADGGAAALEQLDITLDDTQVQGGVQLQALSPLALRFDLTADEVDVDRYLEPQTMDSKPFELPLADLKSLDAKGVLRIRRAIMAGAIAREMTIDVE